MLPHGVTELTAVILCGAGGFQLAHALVFPGARTRMDSMRERGRMAAVIVIGAVCMLFIAGLIEGIFRQVVTSVPIRFTVAGTTAAWWIFYFGFVGRKRDRIAAAELEEARHVAQPAHGRESVPQSRVEVAGEAPLPRCAGSKTGN
jgi:hypothetical protein